MNKLQWNLNRGFSVLFCLVFAWVAFLILLDGNVFIKQSGFVTLLGALALVVLCFVLLHMGSGLTVKRARFTEIVLLVLLFGFYFILQLLFATELRTNMDVSWDFGIVARAAMEYTLYGMEPDRYFTMFSNNTPLLMVLIGAFKTSAWFGYYDFINVGIGMNILSVNIAILLTYLTVRKIKGGKTAAMVAAVFMVLTIPLLSYIAVYYTDTLTLVYPILALYLWTCAKHNIEKKHIKKAMVQIICAAISVAVGSLLKISVLIVLIAMIVDALIQYELKRSLLIACILVAVFCAAYFPANKAIYSAALLPEQDIEDYIPWSHWIMMGLRGNGNYYDPDYKLTLSVPGEERDAFVAQEIQNRIQNYGVGGMLSHLREKCSFVWAEGTYYSSVKISRDRISPSSLDAYILSTGSRYSVYAYYCEWLNLFNILGFLLCAYYLFRRKDLAKYLLPFAVTIFGIFLFQCIWEARSRYLFNLIPIFIVVSVCSFETLYQSLKEFSVRGTIARWKDRLMKANPKTN